MSVRVRCALLATLVSFAIAGPGCADSTSDDDVTAARGAVKIAYGDHADAFGELWVPQQPSDAAVPTPVVVLIHGGFWREGFLLDLMNPLIPSLLERNIAVWNIEYRRVGAGGGYPSTFEDVAAAVDHLAVMPDGSPALIDLDRVAVVGHSAGGQLAVWAAARSVLPAGSVGADPTVQPTLAVAQAGVLDLVGCVEQGVGGTACLDLVGVSPVVDAARFTVTSPTELVPFEAAVVAIHGEVDRIVPTSQSITFVDRATASGMDVAFELIPGADHFSNLDPRHPAWSAVLDILERRL